MKLKILMFLAAMCMSNLMSAQDVILKTDGSTLEALVVEISDSFVKYKRSDNPNGPIYSIDKNTVSSIKYQNGIIDYFNTEDAYNQTINNVYNGNSQQLTDDMLIKLASMENIKPADYYYAKAKKYKKIAWIGGISIAVLGTVINAAVAASNNYPGSWSHQFPIGTELSIVGGAVWFTSFYLAGKYQLKKAKEQAYNVSLIDVPIIDYGNCNLAANINVIKNSNTLPAGLGLGLTLNF